MSQRSIWANLKGKPIQAKLINIGKLAILLCRDDGTAIVCDLFIA